MKRGWQIGRIGDYCEVIAGQSPEGKFYNASGMGIPFYQGKKEFGDKFIEEPSTWTTQITKLARDGDILMSVRAPVGPVNFATKEICIGRGLAAIRSNSELDRNFLFYQLVLLQPKISGREGAVFSSINKSDIENLPIAYAPLSEQQRIVKVLDLALAGTTSAHANTERSLHNARALFESQRQSVFTRRGKGWVERRFDEICDIKHGYAFEGDYFSKEGDYVLLTPGNFYESGGYRDRGEKQKYYTGPVQEEYVLNKGDLLVAMTEQAAGLLGSPIIVPESGKFLHNQRLGLVTAKPGVPWLNDFFFHAFNLPEIRRAIHDSASGTKVRHTSPTKIGRIRISFPPIMEQQQVVTMLDALAVEIHHLSRLYKTKLAALAALRQSLLHKAFSGEL